MKALLRMCDRENSFFCVYTTVHPACIHKLATLYDGKYKRRPVSYASSICLTMENQHQGKKILVKTKINSGSRTSLPDRNLLTLILDLDS
jgi:hypothetical protein